MPISYEAVPNRDISGEEAQQIIIDDVKHWRARNVISTTG